MQTIVFIVFSDCCFIFILFTSYQMTRSRHPHRLEGVTAATTQVLFSFDDDFIEERNMNEDITRIPTEETVEKSNENSITVSVSEYNDSIPADANKRMRLKSSVWNHAKKISKDKAQCVTCKAYVKTPCGGTTTLRKHLMTKHNLTHLTLRANSRIKKDNSMSRERKIRLDHLANLAIFEDGRTFGDLRRSGITKFLAEAIPGDIFSEIRLINTHNRYRFFYINDFLCVKSKSYISCLHDFSSKFFR